MPVHCAVQISGAKLRTFESNARCAGARIQVLFTLMALKTRWCGVSESAHAARPDGREIIMKTTAAILLAATLALSSVPARAVVLDLSTMTCKQFIEGSPDEIKMVLTWMDGWYKGDSDEAIIDTDVFVANAKKFGTFCAANPTISIVNAAEKILGG
jgi:acid stress chaperone HdeB